MNVLSPDLEEYLQGLYAHGDPVLGEMEAYARERRFPIVGPLVGRHLAQLARAIGARRVFELGSGFGYSAIWFCRGGAAEVHCTDTDPDNVRRGRDYLARAGFGERVTYHQEEAAAALRRAGGVYDIVFNDIDKEGYPDTVELAYAHLREGGLFLTDNVLWSSRVLPGRDDGSPATRGVIEFTRRLLAHPGFSTTILPVRDGVAVALKTR